MSLYSPDAGAVPKGTAFVALLSQRDLSLQVPINYVNLPGVSLTAACFGDRRYEDAAAANCLSNLLAVGFRRIEVDVYWDVSRRLWSLCPVQLGNPDAAFNTTTVGASVPLQSSPATLASGQLTGRAGGAATLVPTAPTYDDEQRRRQASGTLSSIPSSVSGNVVASSNLPSVSETATLRADSSTTSLEVSSATGMPSPPSPSGTLIEAGPYSCTASANLDLITAVLASYLGNTETNLNATMRYLIINLHAAARASDPAGSSHEPPPASLPRDSNLISSIIAANNSVYLYTPAELADQRANVNATNNWFAVSSVRQPDQAYLTIEQEGGIDTSPDGWPSEGYVELLRGKRLLAGFGRVDPQMEGYNFSGDAASIFPPGYLEALPDITTSTGGQVTSGCFFQTGEHSLSDVNSSWAISTLNNAPQSSFLTQANDLTACGISPFLNASLNNTSADMDYTPYAAFASAAANWAWDSNEPRNNSMSIASNSNSDEYSCAALNATTGRWQASDCSQSHYGACRVGRTPYVWQVSGQRGVFARIDDGCGGNSSFAVPHTALENTYLVSTWRNHLSQHSDDNADPLLWLNFNDLDTEACWVIGQNTSCPYQTSSRAEERGRRIVVPTVAAVIVFVIAALTLFVKCAANRRTSKRKRRRGGEEWDYEGVPS